MTPQRWQSIHYTGRIVRRDSMPTDRTQMDELERDLRQWLSDRGYALEGRLSLMEYGSV